MAAATRISTAPRSPPPRSPPRNSSSARRAIAADAASSSGCSPARAPPRSSPADSNGSATANGTNTDCVPIGRARRRLAKSVSTFPSLPPMAVSSPLSGWRLSMVRMQSPWMPRSTSESRSLFQRRKIHWRRSCGQEMARVVSRRRRFASLAMVESIATSFI